MLAGALGACSAGTAKVERRAPVTYYDPAAASVPAAPATPESPASDAASRASEASSAPLPADCNNAQHQLFPPEAPWNTPVNERPLASDSSEVIRYLQNNHEKRHRFQIDFSLISVETTPQSKRVPFTPKPRFYSPDCDIAPVPLVPGGRIEGVDDYVCERGDCHLLVVDRPQCRLYELFGATYQNGGFTATCLAIWETQRVYPETGRGEYCTSADAAGMPITPLLFTPDEVARGEIKHAIRLILPNRHIRNRIYVRPATHSTPATTGPAQAPPYGGLFRLKANTNIDHLSRGAQVVANALKKYGMYVVDGGIITFTGGSDALSEHKWSELGLRSRDLQPLEWTDFELIDSGDRMRWRGDCSREQIRL